jgi:1-deoxy-D-xylulose-5-phosphate synthase
VYAALEVRRRVEEERGRRLAVVDGRFAKPLDEELIGAEIERQPIVFTLEDHVLAGGFGSAVAEYVVAKHRARSPRLHQLALPDCFIDHGSRAEQLASAGLDLDSLTRRIGERLERIGTKVRLAAR